MLNRSPASNQITNAFEDIFESIVHSHPTLLLEILAQSTRTRVHHRFVFTSAAEEAVFFRRIGTLVLMMKESMFGYHSPKHGEARTSGSKIKLMQKILSH